MIFEQAFFNTRLLFFWCASPCTHVFVSHCVFTKLSLCLARGSAASLRSQCFCDRKVKSKFRTKPPQRLGVFNATVRNCWSKNTSRNHLKSEWRPLCPKSPLFVRNFPVRPGTRVLVALRRHAKRIKWQCGGYRCIISCLLATVDHTTDSWRLRTHTKIAFT